jgi:hypothetical protein
MEEKCKMWTLEDGRVDVVSGEEWWSEQGDVKLA